ncbi:biopolymer transporter ExbD [Pseudoalteromonas prydzensis]|uniref:Biopolymer transporter ExbD n=1 Tax=Pseudoalteromonas prydzensis TaxID=182141 RepID=A0ABR9FR70_9GAMM|nr:biopolymer transporter ExbD [Pseudoalteromonas prydzensis]MBE0459341.1 biopolymer transporter ExbD [Pseudoalteromonas prydzensis]
MSFNLQQDDEELIEQHDINVTPFIDVMLVLLIIFMVAAPLATVSVPVELPSIDSETKVSEQKPTYLTLQKDLSLVIGEKQSVTKTQLVDTLLQQRITYEQAILIRADRSVDYGDFVDLLNVLSKAGYKNIALVGLEKSQASQQ